jgi:hypothetical protein
MEERLTGPDRYSQLWFIFWSIFKEPPCAVRIQRHWETYRSTILVKIRRERKPSTVIDTCVGSRCTRIVSLALCGASPLEMPPNAPAEAGLDKNATAYL